VATVAEVGVAVEAVGQEVGVVVAVAAGSMEGVARAVVVARAAA
jgi:hypothetical protein